jgi:hypothetical protein
MNEKRHDDERPERMPAPAPKPLVRPGNFFRAAVVGAVAALAPGCFESEPVYGVPYDGGDADAADHASEDAAADDAPPDYPVPYGVPEYGAEDYGAPIYSAPTPR